MKHLFDEFNPISSKQWKQKIQFELDGADYNETLIWNSPEGIKVKPFYDKEDCEKLLPVTTNTTAFKICQNIFVFDIEKSIERALDSIARGAESLYFTIENESINISKLLENLPLEAITIHFHLSFISIDFVKKIDAISKQKNGTVFCNLDPIGQLAKDGNWFTTAQKSNFDTLNLLSKQTTATSLISINARLYQNAGANMVQQIAYSLAHANEYLNRIEVINRPLVFEISVGTNYFLKLQNFVHSGCFLISLLKNTTQTCAVIFWFHQLKGTRHYTIIT